MGGPPRAKIVRENDGEIPFWYEYYGTPFNEIEDESAERTRSSTAIGSGDYADSLFGKKSESLRVVDEVENSDVRLAYEDGKPGSKTSLGKVYYEVKKQPCLLLIDVDVTTERQDVTVTGSDKSTKDALRGEQKVSEKGQDVPAGSEAATIGSINTTTGDGEVTTEHKNTAVDSQDPNSEYLTTQNPTVDSQDATAQYSPAQDATTSSQDSTTQDITVDIKGTTIKDQGNATDKPREMVSSGRLRFKALYEYVYGEDATNQSNHSFEGLIDHNEITFDLEARSNQLDAIPDAENVGNVASPKDRFGRTNRIIVPVADKETADKVFEKFKNSLELTRIKKSASKLAKRDGKSDQSITCTIVRQGVFLTETSISHAEEVASRAAARFQEFIESEEAAASAKITAPPKSVTIGSAIEEAKSEKAAKKSAADNAKAVEKTKKELKEARDKSAADRKTTKYLYYYGLQLLFKHLCSSNSTKPSPAEHIIREDRLKEKSGIYAHAPWSYGLRYTPKCSSLFRVEYDVVPIVHKGQSVAEFASFFLPASIITDPGKARNGFKKRLSGMRVRYPFGATVKKVHGIPFALEQGLTENNSTSNDEESSEVEDHTYTIQDIRSNSEVGAVIQVTPDGRQTESYTVAHYYSRFFDKKPEKKYEQLPLADIGCIKPFWVPLYLLEFSGDQVPPNMSGLTKQMQELRLDLTPQDVATQPPTFGNSAREDYGEIAPNSRILSWAEGMEKSSLVLPHPTSKDNPSYEALETPTVQTPKSGSNTRKPLTGNFEKEPPQISIIYVTSDISENLADSSASENLTADHASNSFLKRVKEALAREASKLTDKTDQRIVNINVDKISTGTIKSGPEIFRLQTTQSQKNLKSVQIEPDAQVLIGIIDDHGMPRNKYDETAAEITRLGERKLGAVTVCLSKSNLEKYFRRTPEEPHFPANILGRIRTMLGHENYSTQELKDHLKDNYPEELIVVGAHISQPSSRATEYCPAVASLVVSTPDKSFFYKSFVQIQPASETVLKVYNSDDLPPDAKKLPRLKELYLPEIQDLKIMMRRAFQEWKDKYLEGKKPDDIITEPRVIFYRDSYVPTDNETFQKESDQIKAAYRDVFGEVREVGLTYITAAKNPKTHSELPQQEGSLSKETISNAPFSFTTSEYEEEHIKDNNRREEDAAKYQYIVHVNDVNEVPGLTSKLDLGRLRTLTQLLNKSSQVGGYTSLALPIHYAQKLARHVLSYYDWLSQKDNSNNPYFARRTPYNARVGSLHHAVMDGYLVTCTQRSDRKYSWDRVRTDYRNGWRHRPWNKKLDDKMFFL